MRWSSERQLTVHEMIHQACKAVAELAVQKGGKKKRPPTADS
jgi:hypothetical protein